MRWSTLSRLALSSLLLLWLPICASAGGPPRDEEPYSGSRPLRFWVSSLASDPPTARILAADAIADIALRHGGSVAAPAVPPLVENLAAQDASVRQAAARALEQIGPAARTSVPALLGMFERDPEPGARRGAALALARIDSSSPDVVNRAALALRDADGGVRVSAGVLLLAAGAAAVQARDALNGALVDPDPVLRIYAAAAIGRSGSPDRAVPLLIDALKSPDMIVRVETAGLLVELAPGRPAIVEALAASLKDPEPQVRSAAADALGAIGRPARPALDALWGHLRDPDDGVRESVLRAANTIKN